MNFIDRFIRASKRIFSDLLALKNIDAYVVSLLAFVFAILGVAGDDVSDDLKMAVILAGLGLLVYNLSVPEANITELTMDDFLDDRSSFVPFDKRVANAKTVWIYGPSSVNLLNDVNTRTIQDKILRRTDGEVRVIIQDPNEEVEVARLTKQLDENISYQVQDLPKAIQDTLNILRRMKGWKVSGTFDYRLLAFNPGFSLVVVDPDSKNGVVIVEFYGYTHEHTASRMHIEITRDQSERWYTYWVHQFDDMWEASRSE